MNLKRILGTKDPQTGTLESYFQRSGLGRAGPPLIIQRKVRAPQGMMPGNARASAEFFRR